jgi:hypothetical protein
MKKLVLICALLLSSAIVLTACGSSAPKAGNTAANDSTEQTQDSTEAVQAASTGNSQGSGYDDIKSKDIPAEYPSDKLPLSKESSDKIMKVYTSTDGSTFDFKIATTRTAKEVIEEYAGLWELENENTMIMEDKGSATLMGKFQGYEIIVNGSEKSPDIPEGAKTYVAILVKKAK